MVQSDRAGEGQVSGHGWLCDLVPAALDLSGVCKILLLLPKRPPSLALWPLLQSGL